MTTEGAASELAPAASAEVNPWLIAVVVSLAAFMEVLDTSIANVALPHIAGDLGASTDESTWVLTSYLVSNAIILPVSGWFVGIVGRKRFFMLCILIFTVSSLLCGVAWSLGLLLLARILQCAGGGGLQPLAQASSLAYIDTYFILSVAAGLMFLLSFTLRKKSPSRAKACRTLDRRASEEIQSQK
jgi:MFS family permease